MTSQLPGAVFFDCDGVLVDTERTASRVLRACLAEIGVAVELEDLRRTITGTSLATAEALCGELYGGPLPVGWFEGFVAHRLDVFREGVDPIPGAIDAVQAVRAAGLLLGVVSQGAHEKMAITLPSSGLADVLGDAPLFSGQDVTRGKPHPDLYLHAAETVGVDPAVCVVVEDSPTGATAAAAAGMRVLGYAVDADHERMRATGAELFFDLRDVPQLIGLPRAAG